MGACPVWRLLVFEARTKYLQVQDTPPAAVATEETVHRLLLLLYLWRGRRQATEKKPLEVALF
jgi:hypothetical protein